MSHYHPSILFRYHVSSSGRTLPRAGTFMRMQDWMARVLLAVHDCSVSLFLFGGRRCRMLWGTGKKLLDDAVFVAVHHQGWHPVSPPQCSVSAPSTFVVISYSRFSSRPSFFPWKLKASIDDFIVDDNNPFIPTLGIKRYEEQIAMAGWLVAIQANMHPITRFVYGGIRPWHKATRVRDLQEDIWYLAIFLMSHSIYYGAMSVFSTMATWQGCQHFPPSWNEVFLTTSCHWSMMIFDIGNTHAWAIQRIRLERTRWAYLEYAFGLLSNARLCWSMRGRDWASLVGHVWHKRIVVRHQMSVVSRCSIRYNSFVACHLYVIDYIHMLSFIQNDVLWRFWRKVWLTIYRCIYIDCEILLRMSLRFVTIIDNGYMGTFVLVY